MHTIDLDRTELELEVHESKSMRCGGPQATSCVDTNQALDQGKHRCITPQSLTFIIEFNIFMLRMIVH
jgi:hypothetical protein